MGGDVPCDVCLIGLHRDCAGCACRRCAGAADAAPGPDAAFPGQIRMVLPGSRSDMAGPEKWRPGVIIHAGHGRAHVARLTTQARSKIGDHARPALTRWQRSGLFRPTFVWGPALLSLADDRVGRLLGHVHPDDLGAVDCHAEELAGDWWDEFSSAVLDREWAPPRRDLLRVGGLTGRQYRRAFG